MQYETSTTCSDYLFIEEIMPRDVSQYEFNACFPNEDDGQLL